MDASKPDGIDEDGHGPGMMVILPSSEFWAKFAGNHEAMALMIMVFGDQPVQLSNQYYQDMYDRYCKYMRDNKRICEKCTAEARRHQH